MAGTDATKRVLVGVDGSDRNLPAVAWALQEARGRGVGLVAAYAWHIPTFAYSTPYFVPVSVAEMAVQGHDLLRSALARVGTTADEVELRVVEGHAPRVLRDFASEPGVELVVVGSRGRGTAADLVLGSTSHSLSHHCPTPLVIVPSSQGGPAPRPRIGHIVAGTDGSEGGDAAIWWAAEEARRTDSLLELVLAWTWTSPFFPADADLSCTVGETLDKAANETLARTVDRLDLHGLAVKLTVREGAAADVLVDRSREADMLVVGRRGLGRTSELFLGSVSHACTHHSGVPVVVVPDKQP